MQEQQIFEERFIDRVPTLKAHEILNLIEDANKNYGFNLPIKRSNRYKQQNINTLIDNREEIVRRIVLSRDKRFFASLKQEQEQAEKNKIQPKTYSTIGNKQQWFSI